MSIDAFEAEVRALVVPYEDELETAEIYGMEVLRRPGARAHDWFAGVRRTGPAVKFNLLPMHAHPEILDAASAGLLKCRAGESFFRFAAADDIVLDELGALLARGFAVYMRGPVGK